MNLTWQKSESLVAPLALDTTLSKKAVYIRKNINVEEVENQNGEKVNKYTYDETTIIYDYKGQIDDIKAPLELISVAGGDISAIMPDILTKTVYIYDATRLYENREAMNIVELAHLYYFLFFKKEELYNEYRRALGAV